MTGPSAPLALTVHLAWVSSISFGGFPTVLPDVRNFVVGTNRWMTNQEFTNLFAMAQSIPGPNMILMMSFVGWKVWGFQEPLRARSPPSGRLVRCTSLLTGCGTGSAPRHGNGWSGWVWLQLLWGWSSLAEL